MNNNEPLKKVLSFYNIIVNDIKNESYKGKKGVWWITTNSGLKVLKKISNSENTLKFTLSAVNHLINNGVNIPPVNKTIDGMEYVNIDGTCYVLSDAIIGKNPSYSLNNELSIIIKGLSNFHKASNGFFPSKDCKPKNHLDTWIKNYTDEIEDMKKFYELEIQSQSNTSVSRLIINEFPYFYERAVNSIKMLEKGEYKNWVNKIKVTGGLCHQDFAAGNLILSKNGLYVIDTDSITTDIPARDLRKILNKIMKKANSWDNETAKSIVNWYQLKNPLTADEWRVVKYDLMFPHLFIGAMNKYYYQRDKEWSNQKYFERIKEMAKFEGNKLSILEKHDFF